MDILSEILISPISFYSLKCQKSNHSVVSGSLQPHGLYSPWNSPGQNTGVDSLSLLQGIFPTQGLNPDLPQFRWILYQLSHQGSPRILEWVAYPFSSGSSQPRNQTGISCIAGGFFTNWTIWEALIKMWSLENWRIHMWPPSCSYQWGCKCMPSEATYCGYADLA